MVKFLTQFTPLVQAGFKNYASKQSPFNAAMSYNMLNAVNGSGAEAEILYPKVMFSRGSLFAPANGLVSLLFGGGSFFFRQIFLNRHEL